VSKLTAAILANLERLDPLRAAVAERGRIHEHLQAARASLLLSQQRVAELKSTLDKLDLKVEAMATDIEKALGDITGP
jgi:hypothetical protein